MVSVQKTWLSAQVSFYNLASSGGIPQVLQLVTSQIIIAPPKRTGCVYTGAKIVSVGRAGVIIARVCRVQQADAGFHTPQSGTETGPGLNKQFITKLCY